MRKSANADTVNAELKRRTSQIQIGLKQHTKSNEQSDQWKIGKCCECFDWFMVTDTSKHHTMCTLCQEHYDVTHVTHVSHDNHTVQ